MLQSLRERDFKLQFPCWEVIFENILHIQDRYFLAAILLFEETTQKFVSLVYLLVLCRNLATAKTLIILIT